MNETKKFELPQTENALAALSDALVRLDNALEQRQNILLAENKKIVAERRENAEKIELLENSSQNIILGIDKIINKLDKVLENDGSGNNNN